MGKRKKSQTQKQSRRKVERFWIEDHPAESCQVDDEDFLCLWLTTADLTDAHHNSSDPSSLIPPLKQSLRSHSGAFRLVKTFHDTDTADHQKASDTSERKIYIRRSESDVPSARPKNWTKNYIPLPKGDCGDGIVNPHEKVPDKYWAQRIRFFTKYDEGIQLDDESWFSVTPESIAAHIASRMASTCSDMVILDAFAGVGGNAIAFGLHPNVSLTICVDTNLERLKLAANNCRVYNVPPEKILFLHGEASKVLCRYRDGSLLSENAKNEQYKKDQLEYHGYSFDDCQRLPARLDGIFLSPPWGGVNYVEVGKRHYGLNNLELHRDDDTTYNGAELLRHSVEALPADRQNIAYYLPRNLNGLMFAQDCHDCGIRGYVDMEKNLLNTKFKAIAVYIQSDAPEEKD